MNNIKPNMVSKGNIPLKVFYINGTYCLAVYQGSISKFDLLLKYRQKDKLTGRWTRIRTPKHIHWAVDILLKMNQEENKTKEFLDFLINLWNNKIKPITDIYERNEILSDELINEITDEANRYSELANKGEYSVKFLLLIAKLLMVQEKTNLHTAYFFKKLLDALRNGEDIFKIVYIATHRRQ